MSTTPERKAVCRKIPGIDHWQCTRTIGKFHFVSFAATAAQAMVAAFPANLPPNPYA